MSTWRINNTLAADFYCSNIGFRFFNQAVDECDLILTSNFDNTPFSLAYGQTMTITTDGSQVFKGRLDRIRRTGASGSEGLVVTVVGGWWYLENEIFRQSNTYEDGAHWTTRWTLGPANIRDTVIALVNQVQASGHITVGTIDLPVVFIPQQELRDTTIADALKTILRWVPGAVVAWDYSGSKPTINVYQPGSSSLATYSVADTGSNVQSCELTKRDDLLIPAVMLEYERAYVRRYIEQAGGTSPTERDVTSYEYVSADKYPASAPGTELKTVRKTMLLSGSKHETIYRHSFTSDFSKWPAYTTSTTISGVPVYGQLGLAMLIAGIPINVVSTPSGSFMSPISGCPYCTFFSVSASIRSNNGSTTFSGNPNDHWLLANKREWAGWMQVPDQKNWVNADLSLLEVTLKSEWTAVVPPTLSDLKSHTCTIMLGAVRRANPYQPPAPGAIFNTLTNSYPDTTDTLESAPSGLARQIYDAQNANGYDGTISIVDEEAVFLAANQRRLAITTPGLQFTGPVQQIAIQAFSGLTTLTIGSPQHLAPQDLIELLRLNQA